MNKVDYIKSLSAELVKLGVKAGEKSEILEDFGQHFADGAGQGLTESQICEKLGDVREIALQYKPSERDDFSGNVHGEQKQERRFKASGLIRIFIMDLFVFSWAIPVLAALVISYYAAVIGVITGGIMTIAASVFIHSIVVSSFSMISVFFLGVAYLALGGLIATMCFRVWRGFVKSMKEFVNLHSKLVMNTVIFKEEAAGT